MAPVPLDSIVPDASAQVRVTLALRVCVNLLKCHELLESLLLSALPCLWLHLTMCPTAAGECHGYWFLSLSLGV